MDYYEIKVDLIMMVKSFGGGFLIFGVVGCVEVMDVLNLGGLGGIYVGNLVVVVFVYVVLDVIEEEGFCECVNVLGVELVEVLNEFK